MYIDLHLHTTCSDGRWTPTEVVEQAASRGLAAIGIADHDVLNGLAEARQAAEQHGLELIDAVELTASWQGRTCHLLGYGVEPECAALTDALAEARRQMAVHVASVLDEIRAAGHELSEADLSRYNTRYATGTSLVLGMLERGILRGPHAKRLLALAGREPRPLSAEAAIALIHQAGGVAVLAHPVRLRRGQSMLPAETFQPLVEHGLDGLEVWHVMQAGEVRQHYASVADQLGLVASGGSDCHGPRSTGVRIGGQQVPYTVLTELRQRMAGRRAEAERP